MSKCLNKVELTFFPSIMNPEERSKVIFFDCGELKTGSFFNGHFYSRGVIYFPDIWAYSPKEPKKEDVFP